MSSIFIQHCGGITAPSYSETGAALRSGGALLPLPTNPWKMIYLCPALTLAC